MAHGDSESVSVQATIPEGVGALEDLKSSPKSVPSNSPRIIEIGSDMSQIEAQLNEDAETEESGRSKVRISYTALRRFVLVVWTRRSCCLFQVQFG